MPRRGNGHQQPRPHGCVSSPSYGIRTRLSICWVLGNNDLGRLEMKLLLALAVSLLAGCTQLTPVPPEARWSGPYHKGSGSGRGYPLWLAPNLTTADYEALAGKSDVAQ